VSLAAAGDGAEFKSQLQFTDVDLQSCLGEMFQFRRLEGRGDIGVAIDATGDSVLAMTRTMDGSANLTGRHGAMLGLNVEQLLRRLERRPLSGTGDFRNGRTPFEKLTVNVKIADGVATVDEVNLEGSKVRLGLAGTASIPTRDFDLKGTAALISTSAGEKPPASELTFLEQAT
jgi:AsmA protein